MLRAAPGPRRTLILLALGSLFMLMACQLGGTAVPATSAPATTGAATSAPTTAAPATSAPGQASPTAAATAEQAAGATNTPAAAQHGFTFIDKNLNRDAGQAALEPSLAVGAINASDPPDLWLAWAENTNGGKRQIFVSELEEDVFAPRGASLNLNPAADADQPSIAFAGNGRLVPWVAWSEPSAAFGGQPQIFASKFVAANGNWQPAGQDRGSKVPSLNHDTKKPATTPFLFPGSGDPTKPPVPWVVWLEDSSVSNDAQLFVAKAVSDTTAIGGFHWQLVGANNASGEPSLNVNVKRDSAAPSGVFAGDNSTVPWVTWSEFDLGHNGRIFTAKGVADANTPGGFKWVNVPPCTPNEAACTLNLNPGKEAKDSAMAAGTVVAGNPPAPWITWAEVGTTGKYQIVVERLDPTTKNSFLQVGGSLNVNPDHDAKKPSIAFVGNVVYVSWLEDDGQGHFVTQLRHLASDPQTGNWVLDSPKEGFARSAGVSQTALAATADSNNLFLAWIEGDPTSEPSQGVVGLLVP